ncbi:uncharacterized protein [Venturia canescens]|uniref:uncharacterized protein n=1 Tax=Venturia canescens TaxID=32260 RepID=UPI001C9C0BD7|nr:uncharacterized protein LOC122411485 [Venturia canescens]
MFKFIVICGCLMAVAHAGLIGGGLLTSVPVAAVQPTLALRPTIATASSSSNIVRGIGPVGTTIVGGRALIGEQGVTTLLAPSGIAGGLAVNGYGLGAGGPILGLW